MDNKSPNEFLNKKIIITGASSGIGSAVATYFLNSGAIVVLVGKDVESMKRISAKFPDHSTIITCDLTTDIEIYAKDMEKIRAKLNKLISEQTGTSLEQVTKDTDRDFWLDSDEAVKYGLISKIISKKSELK